MARRSISWSWPSWQLLIFFAVFFSLLSASWLYFVGLYGESQTSWWGYALPSGAIDYFLWALFVPVIMRVVRIVLNTAQSPFVQFLIHVPVGVVMTSLYILANVCVRTLWDLVDTSTAVPADEMFRELLWVFFNNQLMATLTVYSGIVAACYATQYYRPALHASRLETRFAHAQLQALQAQLQPHFLFNTLNSISVLVHRDPRMADRMISRLSDLLRHTLSIGDRQEVPLAEELDILDRYLEIEAIRFQDRLQVGHEIDSEVLVARVPVMILQPLAENSIRHGIARRATAGRIDIRARREGASTVLEVEDDGPGIEGDPALVIGNGVGLRNCHERLRQLYGEQQEFELISPPAGGLIVRMLLPFQAAEGVEPARRSP